MRGKTSIKQRFVWGVEPHGETEMPQYCRRREFNCDIPHIRGWGSRLTANHKIKSREEGKGVDARRGVKGGLSLFSSLLFFLTSPTESRALVVVLSSRLAGASLFLDAPAPIVLALLCGHVTTADLFYALHCSVGWDGGVEDRILQGVIRIDK